VKDAPNCEKTSIVHYEESILAAQLSQSDHPLHSGIDHCIDVISGVEFILLHPSG
jgi:hypothetical protein